LIGISGGLYLPRITCGIILDTSWIDRMFSTGSKFCSFCLNITHTGVKGLEEEIENEHRRI